MNKTAAKRSLTGKLLSNRLVPNKAAVSIVQVTFGESLIECAQVQVDGIMQVIHQSPILNINTSVSASCRLFSADSKFQPFLLT